VENPLRKEKEIPKKNLRELDTSSLQKQMAFLLVDLKNLLSEAAHLWVQKW